MFKKFPNFKQHDEKDCGPACLRIISKFYGKTISADYLQEISSTNREGTSLLALSSAAEKLGFQPTGARLSFEDLNTANALPCIILWKQQHYVVLYKITAGSVYISDPASGLAKYSTEDFKKHWQIEGTHSGIILALEITEAFETNKNLAAPTANALPFIMSYVKQYKKLLLQLLIGLLLASVLQLIFPFLTQSVVDTGIRNRDVPFIYTILFSQLMVFLGKTSVEIMRSYILLHLSNRINISLLSDFFIKLMKLPLGYFDKKMIGDIFQRIYDHQRVENFLTSGTLNFTFSFISLLVFSGVLLHYSTAVFLVFLAGSILYFLWVYAFMKKRGKLDNEKFAQLKANQDKNFEMVFGMQEIKLHNAERKKRSQWEGIQAKLFKLNIQSLTLKQFQNGGATIINELKNIIVSFICALLVINGSMSLCMMLAVSYIIG
ncbi:MAG TPA: cysteine peptidase family C39 domain-containing protein, partial [Panacibacter sp.]|nr:cysteine peptidase family C39 domain-containing protein [Panacibacter sp.]